MAIEAIRGEKTLSRLGSQFKVHPVQIAKWRKVALEQMPELFVADPTSIQQTRTVQRVWTLATSNSASSQPSAPLCANIAETLSYL